MAHPGQDPKVISVFEIVASYFVDCFFNHVWHNARTSLSGGTSLTDEYVRRIQAFVTGTKNDPRCYSEVVQGVHAYFTNTTRFTTLSFAEFVDKIVSVCVPAEYFRQFTSADKDELLGSVLCDLIANLAAAVTKPDTLKRVIDEHTKTPELTVRILQDVAVGALVAKRAALHNKFLHKMGQARDSVSMDVVEDMKKALRRLVREKAEAEARAATAEEKNAQLREDLRDLRARETKLRQLVELMRQGATAGPAAAGVTAIAAARIPREDRTGELRSDVRSDVRGDVRSDVRGDVRSDVRSHKRADSSTETETESESETETETESSSESEPESKSRSKSKHSHSKHSQRSARPGADTRPGVGAAFFSGPPAWAPTAFPVRRPPPPVPAYAQAVYAAAPAFAPAAAPAATPVWATPQASMQATPQASMQANPQASMQANPQANPQAPAVLPERRRGFMESIVDDEYSYDD